MSEAMGKETPTGNAENGPKGAVRVNAAFDTVVPGGKGAEAPPKAVEASDLSMKVNGQQAAKDGGDNAPSESDEAAAADLEAVERPLSEEDAEELVDIDAPAELVDDAAAVEASEAVASEAAPSEPEAREPDAAEIAGEATKEEAHFVDVDGEIVPLVVPDVEVDAALPEPGETADAAGDDETAVVEAETVSEAAPKATAEASPDARPTVGVASEEPPSDASRRPASAQDEQAEIAEPVFVSYRMEGEFQGCVAGAVTGVLRLLRETTRMAAPAPDTRQAGDAEGEGRLQGSERDVASADAGVRVGEIVGHVKDTFSASADRAAGAEAGAEESHAGDADVEEANAGETDGGAEETASVDKTEVVEENVALELSLIVNGRDLGLRTVTTGDAPFLISLLPHIEELGLKADRDLDVSLIDPRNGDIVLSTGDQPIRWTRYAARLLNYANDTVVGFCFDTLDPDLPSFVSVKVNGSQVGFGLANKLSRVLQRYAPAPAASGLAIPVGTLAPGSVVTLHMPTTGINLEAFLLVPGKEPPPAVPHKFSAEPGLVIQGWRASSDGGWRDKARVDITVDGCEPYSVEANQIEAAAYRAGGSIFGGFSIRLSPAMLAAGLGEVTITDPEEGEVLWKKRFDDQDVFVGELTQMLDYGPAENAGDGNGLSVLFFYNLNRLMTSPGHAPARKVYARLALRALNRLVDTGASSLAVNVLRSLPLELHLAEWRLGGVSFFVKLARTISPLQAESLRLAMSGAHNAKCKTSAFFTGIELVLQTRHSGIKPHIARVLRWVQAMKFSAEALTVVNEIVEANAASPADAAKAHRLVMFDMLANTLQPATA